MKIFAACLSFFLIASCANAVDKIYIASTPANDDVKTFLGIPLADSIDFIRWKITVAGEQYKLFCNYGLSKPNTPGFYNDGKKAEFNGKLDLEKNFYTLHYGSKMMKLVILNDDILHFAYNDNSLMIGNGGWSFTLNNIAKSGIDKLSTRPAALIIKDSTCFDGRTPCGVPGIIPAGKLCYKLKWRIIFYGNTTIAQNGKCKVYGTGYRNMNGRPCFWKLSKSEAGDIRYEIMDDDGKTFVHLREADKNILYFTDTTGKVLVGDADFSYSVNRVY